MNPNVRSRSEFVGHVIEQVYAPAMAKQKAILDQIIIDNTALLGSSSFSFNFLGETYRMNSREPLPRRVNRLAPQLHERMREFLRQRAEILVEQPYINGFFRQVVSAGRNYTDYIALTPSVVHQIIHSIKNALPQGEASLDPDEVDAFHIKHHQAMFMVQQRMALNLILQ